MWIMEHWHAENRAALDEWAAGQRAEPMPEGVVLAHQEYGRDLVERLVNENPNLRVYDYFNLMTYPEASWVGQGCAWFDWLQSVMLSQNGLIWTSNGYPGMFKPTWRVVIRFDPRKVSTEQVAGILIQETRGKPPMAGVWLDHYWPEGPYDWFFDPMGGNFTMAGLNPEDIQAHQQMFLDLPRLLQDAGIHVLGNGQWTGVIGKNLPPLLARYNEGTGEFNSLDTAERWQAMSRESVLSTIAEQTANVDTSIAAWTKRGGWIAFTTQQAGTEARATIQAAYAKARAARDALHVPSTPPPDGGGTGPGGGEPTG